MVGELRTIAPPFVAVPSGGCRIRTRLHPTDAEVCLLAEVGTHLGMLAGRDLADRCRVGYGDEVAGRDRTDRARRKRGLTGESSSRWAGAVTRTSNDMWDRQFENLIDRKRSVEKAVATIERRIGEPTRDMTPAGVETGGYRDRRERQIKIGRLQHHRAELAELDRRLQSGDLSIVRGGKRLLRNRHNLDKAEMTVGQWRDRWKSERYFLTADGEADKMWGNETIRVTPDGILSIRLPTPLQHLANGRHCRYTFDRPVGFSYRVDEWECQIHGGKVRYDISHDPVRDRWYLDASWSGDPPEMPTVDEATVDGIVGVDANDGFLSCWRLDRYGNPVGDPATVTTVDRDARAGTRDGQLRAAVTAVLDIAEQAGVHAVAIENLDFADLKSRDSGRHRRGRSGRRMRKMLAGFPTGMFRDRLVQMAAHRQIVVIAVDPAYTSRWGSQHWRIPLSTPHRKISRHDAAAIVIGRRAVGYHAGRRSGKPVPKPEETGRGTTDQARPERRQFEGTRTGKGHAPPNASSRPRQSDDQATQHRSGPPTEQYSQSLSD